ncbi:hypothetical protein [Sphingosinicella terrae]|uniref:hypothetical protein n=1 Tax=Sphingosinicella terrae TaxID=2172047 RepID=UPI000E0DA561|nr:hypothetical protein [Sphingosinicella terrae]
MLSLFRPPIAGRRGRARIPDATFNGSSALSAQEGLVATFGHELKGDLRTDLRRADRVLAKRFSDMAAAVDAIDLSLFRGA